MVTHGVKLLNITGAIYLGIYMVLPGCLCQVLSIFGVALHDFELPQNVCVVSTDSNLPCSCDHAESKKGELVQPIIIEGEPEHIVFEPLPAEVQIQLLSLDPIKNVRSRAPPPPGHSVSRVFTGVFLV